MLPRKRATLARSTILPPFLLLLLLLLPLLPSCPLFPDFVETARKHRWISSKEKSCSITTGARNVVVEEHVEEPEERGRERARSFSISFVAGARYGRSMDAFPGE